MVNCDFNLFKITCSLQMFESCELCTQNAKNIIKNTKTLWKKRKNTTNNVQSTEKVKKIQKYKRKLQYQKELGYQKELRIIHLMKLQKKGITRLIKKGAKFIVPLFRSFH